ncbi:MAG: L,D-transpeptidase [Gammaproteobacteria bacterium]|nr:L,D-transpeptidase [Gammaproteobacteria bacterium]
MCSIKVNISKQQLRLYDRHNQLIAEYPVSTSKYGIGNQQGSFKTPLGHHQICEKIGDDEAMDEVFIGRKPQGRLSVLKQQSIDLPEDIITARILRLRGQQPGLNQGEGIDSFERYIYIHGTADEINISKPVSHGCIRMRNEDIVKLYAKVEVNTDVWIED